MYKPGTGLGKVKTWIMSLSNEITFSPIVTQAFESKSLGGLKHTKIWLILWPGYIWLLRKIQQSEAGSQSQENVEHRWKCKCLCSQPYWGSMSSLCGWIQMILYIAHVVHRGVEEYFMWIIN